MYGGLPDEFPKLRFAYVEAGAGWLPFWIERITEHYEHRAREVPKMKRAPRDYLQSGQIFVSLLSRTKARWSVLCNCAARMYCSTHRIIRTGTAHFDSVRAIRTRVGLSESAREKSSAATLGGCSDRYFKPPQSSRKCSAWY